MATNGIDIAVDYGQAFSTLDKAAVLRRPVESRAPDPAEAEDFALAPLVDKIANVIARGLVVAIKELEDHIATETRKVGDAVDRRLDTLQITLQDLTKFMGDQRSTNAAVEGKLQELSTRESADVETLRAEARESASAASQRMDAVVAAQHQVNAEQSADLQALRAESKTFSESVAERFDGLARELGVYQEDIAALKTALTAFSARVDALVERLDRQADAFRSMCSAYSQRETELEQLVSGLARLRSFPTPVPSNGL